MFGLSFCINLLKQLWNKLIYYYFVFRSTHVKYSICHDKKFYSDEGWGSEHVSSILNIGPFVGEIFPCANNDFSMCLKSNIVGYYGQSNVNKWDFFLTNLQDNLLNVMKKANADTRLFINLLSDVLKKEIEMKASILKSIPLDRIAHRCGLMILKPFRNKGIATQLIKKSDEYLAIKGFEYVIVETTNEYSKRAFLRNGYIEHFSFNYKDYNIASNDQYCILGKNLSKLYDYVLAENLCQ
jgi:hypothetical protein